MDTRQSRHATEWRNDNQTEWHNERRDTSTETRIWWQTTSEKREVASTKGQNSKICKFACPLGCDPLNVKVGVYNLVSSTSTVLLTLHNYPLITGPFSFISHLNSPGSIQPGSHKVWCTWLTTHTNFPSPTRYQLLLLGGASVHVCKGFTQPHRVNRKFSPSCWQSNPRPLPASCTCYHWATMPHNDNSKNSTL